MLFCVVNVSAQMSIEEINHCLETRPYFNLGLDYNANIVLPDSVQEKFAKVLDREIPEAVLDSMLAFTPQQIEQILQDIKRICKDDSLCVQEQYHEYIKRDREKYKKMYSNDIMPTILIFTAANWQVKKAIPVLEKAIGNTKYDQPSVLMALAKLGNDSIKQVLIEKYTLDYLLKNSQLDTVNGNAIIYDLDKKGWFTDEGLQTAMYLKNKEMLLNILDLIYIRGISGFCIGSDCFDYPAVSFFVDEFCDYNYFHSFPNYQILKKICDDYKFAIWDLYGKKHNKKKKKELEWLLSSQYRTKIKEQLQDWIIKNVNFEE